MKSTVDKYGRRIQDGSIDPTRNARDLLSGIIFNPADDQTPLEVLGFGLFRLKGETESAETGSREHVFCPIDGRFSIKTEGGAYELEREGGPFSAGTGESNASALYVPRDSYYEITGRGDIIYYTAPSSRKMKSVHIGQADRPNLSRGDLSWRRDVVTLVEPGVSTNLNIGETYSPPALWSGTPPHVHDVGNASLSESEHEEVYYHVSRMHDRQMPNYPVQLMFDGSIVNDPHQRWGLACAL